MSQPSFELGISRTQVGSVQPRPTSVGMTFVYFHSSRVKQTSWVTGYWTQLPQCNCCSARDRAGMGKSVA